MKKFVSVYMFLLTIALLCSTILEAQTVKVKREAMSPGRRSSGPPNYTAPAGPYYVSTGLRVVGKGTKVFLSADTTGSGATTVTSFAWTFAGLPAGSVAVFDSTSTQFTSFKADTAGVYYVQVTVNGTVSARDTIRSSTYVGVTSTYPGCAVGCHAEKVTAWQATPHASIFSRGITGQLEIDMYTAKGAYATSCVKWESVTNNGNFGYLANQSGWDTSWYKPYTLAGGDYWIPYQDSSILKALSPAMTAVGNIGCESCHGPGKDHNSQEANIAKSFDAGVCNQCHDAPKKHRIGSYYNASAHATMHKGHASGTSCYPCHSGTALVKYIDNKSNPGWSLAEDATNPVSCSVCHDPHGNSNPNHLRTVSFDSTLNGYKPAPGDGGKGQLCMNCHHSRYDVRARVTNTPPYYGFVNRYGPHYSPQADMFYGTMGYEYGDSLLSGLRSHAGVEDGCVTCHMQERVNGSSVQSNHEFTMKDSTGDFVGVCQKCHGPITSFDDIKASYDYDGNGKVEGVETEIAGLLTRLKAKLPIDDATGEPTTASKDSLLVKNRPDYVQGIWNYYFVKNDLSGGMHNARYAIALLQKALGIYYTDVRQVNDEIPKEFGLKQNYPNPFNPSTKIEFSIAKQERVKLEVYDILGKLVNTIVDKDMNAGNYQVGWVGTGNDGMKVPSGIYLLRIQAGSSFTSVRKMLLVK
jgi:predicted CXXCH cytochrome family protein